MSAVLTKDFRTNNLLTFMQAYFNSSLTNMYMSFGYASPWPADINGKYESDPAFIIPLPDTNTIGDTFRTTFTGGVKLLSTDVSPTIPRINWSTDTTYTKNTCVVTTNWNVYLATVDITSNTIPVHTDYTADVNGWHFLYQITAGTNFITNDWIPVYYNGNTGTQPGVNPDPNSIYKSRAYTFMVDKAVTTSLLPLAAVSEYRQIALWGGVTMLDNTLATNPYVTAPQININDGTVIYVDNRLPVYRYNNQSEEYKILIGF